MPTYNYRVTYCLPGDSRPRDIYVYAPNPMEARRAVRTGKGAQKLRGNSRIILSVESVTTTLEVTP